MAARGKRSRPIGNAIGKLTAVGLLGVLWACRTPPDTVEDSRVRCLVAKLEVGDYRNEIVEMARSECRSAGPVLRVALREASADAPSLAMTSVALGRRVNCLLLTRGHYVTVFSWEESCDGMRDIHQVRLIVPDYLRVDYRYPDRFSDWTMLSCRLPSIERPIRTTRTRCLSSGGIPFGP
ncbi:hypothetical protein [Rhodospirillaceae bacterium SYSU D60014]|uniref:hypothetical protein n=1 Tax=Virgifigura deserti TaxID=2268457 RepID=UPI000E670F3D